MRKFLAGLLLLAAALLPAAAALRPPHSESLVHAATPHALGCNPSDAERAYILEVLSQLNDYRIANGLSPLQHDLTLMRAMIGHCHHMPQHGFFAHTHSFATEPESQTPSSRAQANGGGTAGYGENIAVGYPTPTDVMNGWKASPGHNANMLTAAYTRVGIGYYAGGDYWGQLFGWGAAVEPDQATPTIVSPASATPSTVTGTSTSLSVLGSDDMGEVNLTYTWSVTSGPSGTTFSPNGTNGSKNTTATFAAAGSYTIQVAIRDGTGLTTTDTVSVTVSQTATTLSATPADVSVQTGGTQQFTAAVQDQFGQPMSATVGWSVSGGGTIDSTGLFTAGGTPGGPHTVTATSGSASDTASVDVLSSPPTLTTIAVTPPSALVEKGLTVQFSATGYDQAGNPLFTQPSFAWSVNAGGTIDSTGLFTAFSEGAFTVTASSGGVSGTASVTVEEEEELPWYRRRCGALGAEVFLILALARLLRRRRS